MSDSEEQNHSDDQASDSEINEDGEDSPYKCAAPDEIPALLEQLKASGTDEFDKATEILGDTIQFGEGVATEHLIVKIPYIVDLTRHAPSPERRAALIELIWKLLTVGEQSRAAARPFVKDLTDFLLVEGPSGNRFYLAQSLDTIVQGTDQDDALRTEVLEILKNTVFAIPKDTIDPTTTLRSLRRLTYVTEVLQTILMFGHDNLRALAFKAGALDFTLHTCRTPSAECRKIAVSCIQQVYIYRDKIAEEAPDTVPDSVVLQELALNTLIERLANDDDVAIATSTLDFLESAEVPDGFLSAHATFPEALVCHIARWSTDTHFPFVYDALITQNEDDNVVIDGFRKVWSEENVSVELDVKLRIVRRLDSVYPSVRQAAVKAGLVDFVLRMLGPNEALATAVSILNGVQAILEQDQGFGGHLFEGCIIPKLIQLLADVNAAAASRAVAASTLCNLIDSYTPDLSEPLRKNIVNTLTVPETFAQIASIIQDPSKPQVVNETFNLLCNVFKDNGDVEDDKEEEDNDEASLEPNDDTGVQEYVDRKPTIASTLKDRLVDEALVSSTIAALGVPELSSGASDLLAQIAYYYPRGLALVAAGLGPVVPTAPASFFAALLPEGGRYTITWEPWHEIEKAVVDAGGFGRLDEIMKELVEELEKGEGSASERKTAVQGARALLWGEDVDKDLARRSEYLPKLVTALLSDGNAESLIQVKGLMDQLTEYGRENPLEDWKEVVTTDAVGHALLRALATVKPEDQVYDDLDMDAMSAEEYKRVLEKRQIEEFTAQRQYEDTITSAAELVKFLAPILPSFRTLIAMALLSAYFKDDRNCFECALESFIAFENPDASNPEYAPLVEAVQATLASPEPPSSYKILGATRSSLILGIAFYLGGVFPWLIERITSTSGDSNNEPKEVETLEVVDIFSSVIDNLRDSNSRLGESNTASTYHTHLLTVRTTFFGAPALLDALHTSIIQEGAVGDDWDRYPVINGGETLFKLASGYSVCLPALISLRPSIVPSLIRVYDDEHHDAEASTAPLLGLLVGGSENIIAESDSDNESDTRGLSSSDVGSVKEILRKHVEQLVEPKDAGKGKGKKGKKKNKRYEPRLSLKQVIERSTGFLSGAVAASEVSAAAAHGEKKGQSGVSAALDVVVDSGTVDLALKALVPAEVLETEAEVGVSALRSVQFILKLSKSHLLGSHGSTAVLKPQLQDLSNRLTAFAGEKQDDDEVEQSTKKLIYSIVADVSFNTLLDGVNSQSEGGIPPGSFGEAVGSTPWVDALKNLGKVLWLNNELTTTLQARLWELVDHLRDLENGKLEDGLRADIREFLGGVTR